MSMSVCICMYVRASRHLYVFSSASICIYFCECLRVSVHTYVDVRGMSMSC